MRWCISIGAVLIAGAMAGGNLARGAAPDARADAFLPLTHASLVQPYTAAANFSPGVLAQRNDISPVVDVELVLAVDISYSMDLDELALQREGYALAVTSPEFLKAMKSGPIGKVAITYFEWAASSDQKIIIPWRVIDGPESAGAVAEEILKAPLRRASRTSISGAINFSLPLFEQNPYRGIRRVIDISGDGANNNGVPVTVARDAALEKGITINGLPVMVKELNPATMDIPNLDLYYEDCVIGGPGSFVISIKAKEKFAEAIRTKLVLEVANRMAERPVIPVSTKEPRVPCMIGERIWQDRWGRW